MSMFTNEVDSMDEDNISDNDEILTNHEEVDDAETVVDAEAIAAEDHRSLIAQLEGTPKHFDDNDVAILEQLAEQGIAADFGADGWARGYKWHMFK